MIAAVTIANTIKAFATMSPARQGTRFRGSNDATWRRSDPTSRHRAGRQRHLHADHHRRLRLPAGSFKAPLFSRFDLSFQKRFRSAARERRFQVDLEHLRRDDYNAVFPSAANLTNSGGCVTTAYADLNNSCDPGGHVGSRLRLNW